jgi:TonB family protein
VEQPRVIYAPPPKMPRGKKADSKGFAELSFVVNTQGLPIEIQVRRATEPSFGEASVEALRSWRFEPARKQGQPIPFPATTRYRFNMPAQDLVDALAPPWMARVNDPGVTSPEAKSRVLPEYVEAARKIKNTFWVTLYLEIDESGIPNAVKLTGPIQTRKENESKALVALVPLTVEALKQWRFTPALQYGKPVRVAACIQFKFLRRVGLKTPSVPDVGADFVAEVRMP